MRMAGCNFIFSKISLFGGGYNLQKKYNFCKETEIERSLEKMKTTLSFFI